MGGTYLGPGKKPPPPPRRQRGTASISYMAGGVPLAFKPEDFLVVDVNECRRNGTGECDDICVNQYNSYMCLDICPVGFNWDDAEEKCVGEPFHIWDQCLLYLKSANWMCGVVLQCVWMLLTDWLVLCCSWTVADCMLHDVPEEC